MGSSCVPTPNAESRLETLTGRVSCAVVGSGLRLGSAWLGARLRRFGRKRRRYLSSRNIQMFLCVVGKILGTEMAGNRCICPHCMLCKMKSPAQQLRRMMAMCGHSFFAYKLCSMKLLQRTTESSGSISFKATIWRSSAITRRLSHLSGVIIHQREQTRSSRLSTPLATVHTKLEQSPSQPSQTL